MSKRLLLPLFITLGVILGVLVVGAIYAFTSYRSIVVTKNGPAKVTSEPSAPTIAPSPTPDPDRDFGVLLLGYGGGGHEGGYLTDTMILAYIQPRNQKITLISIPRDLWVPIPVTETDPKYFKINAAYAVGKDDRKYSSKPIQYTGRAGGGILAIDTVKKVTGLNVEHFATLSFAGFTKSIDTLGGVNVNVPLTFDDVFYPIEGEEKNTCGFSDSDIATATAALKGDKLEQFFTCRYEHLHFDAGKQQMDGTTALKFVRSRHSAQLGAGGDFARSQRQKALIQGIKDQIFNIGFLPKMVPFISSLKQDFETDIALDTMSSYVSRADDFRTYKISSIALSNENVLTIGTSSDRQSILMPKEGIDHWEGIQQYIQDQLNGVSATPSADPTKKATSTPAQ
ncbi:MAG: LCP family protein [Patescibacteria group bacterium]